MPVQQSIAVANQKDRGNSRSGHGSEGMGGQPSDDPRILERGGEGRENDDRGGGTGPIDGASGKPTTDRSGGGSGNETVGVQGDKALGDLPTGTAST